MCFIEFRGKPAAYVTWMCLDGRRLAGRFAMFESAPRFESASASSTRSDSKRAARSNGTLLSISNALACMTLL